MAVVLLVLVAAVAVVSGAGLVACAAASAGAAIAAAVAIAVVVNLAVGINGVSCRPGPCRWYVESAMVLLVGVVGGYGVATGGKPRRQGGKGLHLDGVCLHGQANK